LLVNGQSKVVRDLLGRDAPGPAVDDVAELVGNLPVFISDPAEPDPRWFEAEGAGARADRHRAATAAPAFGLAAAGPARGAGDSAGRTQFAACLTVVSLGRGVGLRVAPPVGAVRARVKAAAFCYLSVQVVVEPARGLLARRLDLRPVVVPDFTVGLLSLGLRVGDVVRNLGLDVVGDALPVLNLGLDAARNIRTAPSCALLRRRRAACELLPR
jgi:hypothetical protein